MALSWSVKLFVNAKQKLMKIIGILYRICVIQSPERMKKWRKKVNKKLEKKSKG